MTGRVATATVLVLALACPFASRAADIVEPGATESASKPIRAARRSASLPRAPIPASDDLSTNPYAGISNEELADVADRWDALNQDERRWFFAEVRKRLMATNGVPELPIGPDARFGQVVRNRDGTVAHIEAMRPTAQPAGTAKAGDDPRAYGLGFERRLEVRTRSARSPEGSSGQQLPGKPDGGT